MEISIQEYQRLKEIEREFKPNKWISRLKKLGFFTVGGLIAGISVQYKCDSNLQKELSHQTELIKQSYAIKVGEQIPLYEGFTEPEGEELSFLSGLQNFEILEISEATKEHNSNCYRFKHNNMVVSPESFSNNMIQVFQDSQGRNFAGKVFKENVRGRAILRGTYDSKQCFDNIPHMIVGKDKNGSYHLLLRYHPENQELYIDSKIRTKDGIDKFLTEVGFYETFEDERDEFQAGIKNFQRLYNSDTGGFNYTDGDITFESPWGEYSPSSLEGNLVDGTFCGKNENDVMYSKGKLKGLCGFLFNDIKW